MELKHTIEILTKDIQEIEKLVRNLNNYPQPPHIELDLAMSKMRRVYELLYSISDDFKNGSQDQTEQTPAPTEAPNDTIIQHETVVETQDAPEPMVSPQIEKEPPVISPSSKPQNNNNISKKPTEPINTNDTTSIDTTIETATEKPATILAESSLTSEDKKETEILADKFEKDKSLNDRIANQGKNNLSSKLSGEKIDSIKRNIGINDRFLIIRELLDGNNDAYNELINSLDASTDYHQAYEILQSKFSDKLDHDGVKMLDILSKRKYINS